MVPVAARWSRRWETATLAKSSTLAPRSRPPLAAIMLGRSERSDEDRRYGVWLVWFMRALSLGWIALGLANWALVLMGPDDGQGAFDMMPSFAAGAIVFFAVLDLIAAVGLWLAAAWGGVVWLVAVAAQWFAVAMLPGFFPFDVALAVLELVLVGAYFLLTYRAASEIDQ